MFCIYNAEFRDYVAYQRGIETAFVEGGNEVREASLGDRCLLELGILCSAANPHTKHNRQADSLSWILRVVRAVPVYDERVPVVVRVAPFRIVYHVRRADPRRVVCIVRVWVGNFRILLWERLIVQCRRGGCQLDGAVVAHE